MFDYPVMTEAEALRERFQLLPDGEYDATVDKVEPRVSSSGNNMYQVSLSVYDRNGATHPVTDFLLFTKNMMWKTIHFAESAGLMKEYETKKFTPEIIKGKNVRVLIRTQAGSTIPDNKLNGKAPGAKYPDKNSVEDYLSKDGRVETQDSSFTDDSIPF